VRCLALALVTILGALPASTLAAQAGADSARQATLSGTIRDHSGAPLRGVRVTAWHDSVLAVTDSVGQFALRGLAPGVRLFFLRRLGLEPAEFWADLAPGGVLRLDVTLEQMATPIAGMETRGERPRRATLAIFERHRAANAGGRFLVRADIEERHPQRLSDMLRSLAGVQIAQNGLGPSRARMTRAMSGATRDCPIKYWVDGVLGLPPEYRLPLARPACGTIVIWTRTP
jgi:hypothetical protein